MNKEIFTLYNVVINGFSSLGLRSFHWYHLDLGKRVTPTFDQLFSLDIEKAFDTKARKSDFY